MKIVLYCGALALAAASLSLAQDVQSATVVGTITDSSRAVIPNASVTVTNKATNLSAHVTSNADGAYYVPFQSAGTYDITIQAPGFKRYVRNGLTLQIGQTPRFDAQLEVGATGDVVEVTAEAPLLATDNAVVGGTDDAKIIHETPMVQAKP